MSSSKIVKYVIEDENDLYSNLKVFLFGDFQDYLS